jgi:hypothetical protein
MCTVMTEKLMKLGTVEEVPCLWWVVGASPGSDFIECHRDVEDRNFIEVYRDSVVGSSEIDVEFGGGDRSTVEESGFDYRGSRDV